VYVPVCVKVKERKKEGETYLYTIHPRGGKKRTKRERKEIKTYRKERETHKAHIPVSQKPKKRDSIHVRLNRPTEIKKKKRERAFFYTHTHMNSREYPAAVHINSRCRKQN